MLSYGGKKKKAKRKGKAKRKKGGRK